MPIRRELRKFYGREWRTVTRPRILARAGYKCEQCGIANHGEFMRIGGVWLEWRSSRQLVWRRSRLRVKFGSLALPVWHDSDGSILAERPAPGLKAARMVRIVLTIGHVNHVAGDDRDENLKAWCQWCHLHHDKLHHAETRATRKDAARPLLSSAHAFGGKFEALWEGRRPHDV